MCFSILVSEYASAHYIMSACFPAAMLSGDVDAAVASTLARRGFTAKNTLLAHSVCSDEVNGRSEPNAEPDPDPDT